MKVKLNVDGKDEKVTFWTLVFQIQELLEYTFEYS